MNKFREVVLVNSNDQPRGTMEKMEAHRKGELHRAFSIFIFDNDGNMLLQKRSNEKYHSGGLWSNTCCGHPNTEETIAETAHHRLKEEMGMDCLLHFGFKNLYKVRVGKELTEHEIDYVFFSICTDKPGINPSEVSEYRYASMDDLKEEIKSSSEIFTEWFKLLFPKAVNFYELTQVRPEVDFEYNYFLEK